MNSTSSIGFGSNAFQNAQLGISRGMANLSRDAQVVAQGSAAPGAGDDSTTAALVDARQQALDVEAAAKALSITDKTLGALLDIKA